MDKRLIINATSSDDSPTSGYQISEIVKTTNVNYDACCQIQNLLLERLEKKRHHNIKYKCLILIKHICRNGRPEFKRDIQRRTETIRELLQFKGPPDPLRGDQIYQRVRDAAREVLDSIFDSHVPGSSNSSTVSRIIGMGSDINAGIENSSSSKSGNFSMPTKWFSSKESPESMYTNYNKASESNMAGFGNPNFSQPTNSQKGFLSRATDAVGTFAKKASGKGKKEDALNTYEQAPPAQSYDPYAHQKAQLNTGFSSDKSSNSWGSPQRPASQVGGVWASNPPTSVPTNQVGKNSGAPMTGRAGGADVGGEYERNQILDLCAPGGTRAVPPPEKLESFTKAVETLDSELVGSIILEQLQKPEWQTQSKALCVIEAIAKLPGCDALYEYFQDWAEDMIQPLCNAPKAAVRDRSVKVLKILGLKPPTQTVLPKQQVPRTQPQASLLAASQNVQPEVNLLESFDTPAAPVAPTVPQSASSHHQPISTGFLEPNTGPNSVGQMTQSPTINGLFDGMETKSPPPTVPSQPLVPPTQVSSNDAGKPASESSSLFGDLSIKPQPALPPQPNAAQQTVPSQSVAVQNFAPQPTAAEAPTPPQTAIPQPAAALAPTPPQSAIPQQQTQVPSVNAAANPHSTLLDDLSALSPPAPPQPKDNIPTLLAEPSDAAFDPLMNTSQSVAPAANNMMAMQMQQLQYQNMLLQQQMMQMSMKQQQPRPSMGMAGVNVVGQNPMQYNVRTTNALNSSEPTGSSAFGFMAGGDTGKKKEDSFSFVKDAMKTSAK